MNTLELDRLLQRVEHLPLECDGLSRVLSVLLRHADCTHRVLVGSLCVDGHGEIPLHCWIELENGQVCDLRARMWLGSKPRVPHGRFTPAADQQYVAHGELAALHADSILFEILAGAPVASFF